MAIFFSPKSAWNLSNGQGYLACGGNVGMPTTTAGGLSAANWDAYGGWSDDIVFSQNDTVTDFVIPIVAYNSVGEMTDRNTMFYFMENSGSVTISIATPAVITKSNHGYSDGDAICFTTTGALPTGISANIAKNSAALYTYYLKVVDQNTFWIYTNKAAAISGGSTNRINTTGTQSGTHTLWYAKSKWEYITPNEILNHNTYANNQVIVYKNFELSSPIAVTTDSNKYKLIMGTSRMSGTTTTNYWTWAITGSSPNYSTLWAACGTTTATATSGTDFLIIRDTMTIDTNFTTKPHLASGATAYAAAGWIANKANWTDFDSSVIVRWQNPPTSSYTFTMDGCLLCSIGTGIEIGTAVSPIPLNKPAHITMNSSLGSNKISGFRGAYVNGYALVDRSSNVKVYGAVPNYQITTLSQTAPIFASSLSYPGGNKISTAATWAANDVLVVLGTSVSLPTGLTAGTLYMLKNKSGSTYDIYDKTGTTQITFTGSGSGSLYISKAIYVTDSVDWEIGDFFVIGYEDNIGLGDTYSYVIGDMTADKKAFSCCSSALYPTRRTYYNATNFIGAPVINLTRRGVKTSSTYPSESACCIFSPGLICELNGISNSDIHNSFVGAARLVSLFGNEALDQTFTVKHTVTNCVFSGSGQYPFSTLTVPCKGFKIDTCFFNTSYCIGSFYANSYLRNNKNLSSGAIEMYDVFLMHGTLLNYSATGTSLSIPWKCERVKIYNQNYALVRSGVGSTWTDCQVYSINGQPNTGKTGGVWVYENAVNTIATNDKVDRVSASYNLGPYYSFNPGSTAVNNRILNPQFDTIYTPSSPTHLAFADSIYVQDFFIENPNINMVVGQLAQELMIQGSRVTVLNWNSVANDDRNYLKYGQIVRTGTSLGDTTAHNSGYAMRFQPNSGTDSLTYSLKIPVGNIQNKTAGVGVWCKIGSSNYWSSNYQMPRLYLTYDNGTTTYVEASKTAGSWQFLHIPFTPITTYGEVTVTFDVRSDAATSDSYVYFDDFSTFYPAGTTLNLGSFDLWALGMPVGPYISTTIAAADVWAVSPSSFGSGTVGAKINTIEIKVDDSTAIGRMG